MASKTTQRWHQTDNTCWWAVLKSLLSLGSTLLKIRMPPDVPLQSYWTSSRWNIFLALKVLLQWMGCSCSVTQNIVKKDTVNLASNYSVTSRQILTFQQKQCLWSTPVTHCQLTISLENSRLIVVVYIYFLYILAHRKPQNLKYIFDTWTLKCHTKIIMFVSHMQNIFCE